MRKVVVIMFHSVGLEKLPWRSAEITEPIDVFAAKMEALQRRGYASSFFKDHVPHQHHGRREVVLTFDDGYLDNWVHVFPILRRYGLKGTIFVNPWFVDPRDIIRPQAADARGGPGPHDCENCCAGFLSWPEMREMEASGLIDIQSHCLTHTSYFAGPRIVDFWHPGCVTEPLGPTWMLWNQFPDRRPFYLTKAVEDEAMIPYGTPVYEHGKALVTRRYSPDGRLEQILPEYVDARGGAAFFDRGNWREELEAVVREHRGHAGGSQYGRFETEAEYLDRVHHELSESKRLLEHELDKRIEAVCWPAGGVSEQVVELARQVGYRRFTLPSAWKAARARGKFADLTPRIGGGRNSQLAWERLGWRPDPGRLFMWGVEAAAGPVRYKWWLRLLHVLRRVFERLSGR